MFLENINDSDFAGLFLTTICLLIFGCLMGQNLTGLQLFNRAVNNHIQIYIIFNNFIKEIMLSAILLYIQ